MGTADRYSPPEKKSRSGVSLSLSGGGFRAALFHLGALRRLSETGQLGRITTITSVSGGSIAAGLLATMWKTLDLDPATGVARRFPDFEARLRDFCSKDLRTGPLLTERLDPRNWLGLAGDDHSATDLLAHAYQDRLVGRTRLGELTRVGAPGSPQFVFCASNMQTGVSFEMRGGGRVGDYQIGYADLPDFPLADAVAASSAFPIAFPPLVLKFDPERFTGGKLPLDVQRACARRIVLTDGGVYDNMGLEPVWKSHATVFVSDGGKPFAIDRDPGTFITGRLLRANDIIANQSEALRKRWLVDNFVRRVYDGTYWGVGTEIDGYPCYATQAPPAGYLGDVLQRIREVRTDLNVFSKDLQAVLINHGWLLADAGLRSFAGVTGPAAAAPFPDLLDPGAAARALA